MLAALGLMLVAGRAAGTCSEGAEGQRHEGPAPRVQRLPRHPSSRRPRSCCRRRTRGLADRCTNVDARRGWSTSRRTSSMLREQNSNTITVGAGDLIGASPLASALFHDEPTIEAMNLIGLQVSGVGNHEFDEGVNELLRMQNGGCHPVDGCQDGTPFAGALFKYLAANVFYAGTNETILPPYEVEKIDNAKIAFIGLTLEGTPTDRHAVGRRRPRVPAGGADGQCTRQAAPQRTRAFGHSSCSSTREASAEPAAPVPGRTASWTSTAATTSPATSSRSSTRSTRRSTS